MSEFTVVVRFNDGSCVPTSVSPNTTVGQIKTDVCSQTDHDITADQVSLVLQGRELPDKTSVKDCDLGVESSLFAVKRLSPAKPDHSKQNKPYQSLEARLLSGISSGLNSLSDATTHTIAPQAQATAAPSGNHHDSSRPSRMLSFYVYCQHEGCSQVQPAKARVRCDTCKHGGFTLTQNPRGWEDVLTRGILAGRCHTGECQGKYAEVYFKCASAVHRDGDSEAAVLELIRSNHHNIPCAACTDIRSPVLVFPCDAGHSLCLECFTQYCSVKLAERAFTLSAEHGYTVLCPASCDESAVKNSHHFYILGKDKYEQYKRFGAEEFVIQNAGVICPTVGCEAAILVPDLSRTVTCVYGCKLTFCRVCRGQPHEGLCDADSFVSLPPHLSLSTSHIEESRWDRMSRVTIAETTKPCPNCRVATERAGGCMHISCVRCQYEWCWVCRDKWTNECMADHWFTEGPPLQRR